MQIVENIALITINETMFVQMVSFLMFVFIMNRLMFRPLRNVMEERNQNFQKMISEIGKAKEQIQSFSDAIKLHEQKIDQETVAIKLQFEEQGQKEASLINVSVRKDITEINQKARVEIQTKIATATKSIQDESRLLAIAIIEKILNRRLI